MPHSTMITVKDLTKSYRLYEKPSDRVKETFHPLRKRYHRVFHALEGVSFEVRAGESVGIVGRNGSGKSTLLQVLAGILKPTHGEVAVEGRTAALLELGHGFHPEFTGRQNIYLAAGILGISHDTVQRRFHEIEAFADIGQFMDQPIKVYSTGMVLRLAFAIQAHVPADILLIDEILAVGDEAFQRKCMNWLEDFQKRGGTILLVSHDMQTIVRQCERCLLLAGGRLILDGAAKPITDFYHRLMYSSGQDYKQLIERALAVKDAGGMDRLSVGDPPTPMEKPFPSDSGPPDAFDPDMPKPPELCYGTGHALITHFGMFNPQGRRVNVLVAGRPYTWIYRVSFEREAEDVHFGMMLKTKEGLDVSGIHTEQENRVFRRIERGTSIEVCFSIRLNVIPGPYFLNAGVMGTVEGKRTYLQRRVDVEMIRVISPRACRWWGIAFLDHEIRCREVGPGAPFPVLESGAR